MQKRDLIITQEIPISHFLDMAYDITKFTSPASTDSWLQLWATREFGSSVASGTAEAMSTYGRLIIRRKYELLNREPFLYSTTNYDEAESVLEEWIALEAKAQKLHDSLDTNTQVSFFEMVLHPIMAGGIVQRVYINAARNKAYAAQKRMTANVLADDVKKTYAQHTVVQKRYHSLLDGKWNHMMDQVVFGYNNWYVSSPLTISSWISSTNNTSRQDPSGNTMPSVTTISTTAPSSGLLGIAIQGSTSTAPDTTLTLLPLDAYTPENRTLELFIRGSGTIDFTITPSVPYITFSPSTGTLTHPSPGNPQIRTTISIDWTQAPRGSSTASLNITPSKGSAIKISLPLTNDPVPTDFKGYIESAGALAIEMSHFSSMTPGSSGSNIAVIPNYGRTDSGITILPISAGTQTVATAPKAVYTFYSFTSATNAKASVYLPPSFNVNPSSPLKYAIALDDATPTTVTPVPSATLGAMPGGWNEAVVNGARVVSTGLGKVEKGVHKLSVWILEPGTVVQRVVLDLGGVKSSYLGPREGVRVGV